MRPRARTPVELNIPETSDDDDAGRRTRPTPATAESPIGSTFNQMLYAAKFWDSSILLSGRVNSESKIIYDRDPREMVREGRAVADRRR